MERERFHNPDDEWPDPRPDPDDEPSEPWARRDEADSEGGEIE